MLVMSMHFCKTLCPVMHAGCDLLLVPINHFEK
jgi:hypothetical protein